MYFTRQNTEDLINMRREALEAFAAGAAIMTETAFAALQSASASVLCVGTTRSHSDCGQVDEL